MTPYTVRSLNQWAAIFEVATDVPARDIAHYLQPIAVAYQYHLEDRLRHLYEEQFGVHHITQNQGELIQANLEQWKITGNRPEPDGILEAKQLADSRAHHEAKNISMASECFPLHAVVWFIKTHPPENFTLEGFEPDVVDDLLKMAAPSQVMEREHTATQLEIEVFQQVAIQYLDPEETLKIDAIVSEAIEGTEFKLQTVRGWLFRPPGKFQRHPVTADLFKKLVQKQTAK